MTKVIIIGEKQENINKLECIVFSKSLIKNKKLEISIVEEEDDDIPPSDYEVIELIAKRYLDDYDLMYAHDGTEAREGLLYLGYFNDGVV